MTQKFRADVAVVEPDPSGCGPKIPMSYSHPIVKRYCPRCGDAVLRIPRRTVDRLISIVRPVLRYQCTSLECGWQGNLPRRPEVRDPGLAPLSTPTGSR